MVILLRDAMMTTIWDSNCSSRVDIAITQLINNLYKNIKTIFFGKLNCYYKILIITIKQYQ